MGQGTTIYVVTTLKLTTYCAVLSLHSSSKYWKGS